MVVVAQKSGVLPSDVFVTTHLAGGENEHVLRSAVPQVVGQSSLENA
jgi:hypothetical protein